MKKCRKCGQKRPDYELNCGNCGGELYFIEEQIAGDFSAEMSFADLPLEEEETPGRFFLTPAGDEEESTELPEGAFHLGRDETCCELTGLRSYLCRPSRKYVSRDQAILTNQNGKFWIEDVSGKYGSVYLNHWRIAKNRRYSIQPGDLLGFGSDGNYGQYAGEEETCAFLFLRSAANPITGKR